MTIGVIGSGSWGTAQVKILTDNGHRVCWGVRNERIREHLFRRRHNPQYLSSVQFDTNLLDVRLLPDEVIRSSDIVVVAVPSAYLEDVFAGVDAAALGTKKVISAVKGMVPGRFQLLNDFLQEKFSFPLSSYVSLMGPCHAEEVASERLSYLTFSGSDLPLAEQIAGLFANSYINTVVNKDVYGGQYAAIMKNIYALGAGIAHGLEYGDNFLSVFIANCAREMGLFLQKATSLNTGLSGEDLYRLYTSSVYLGDLLVTSYSLYSRNRTFGNMIGKGYSVQSAQLEMNMIAEGYPASRAIQKLNEKVLAHLPIATAIYEILWEKKAPEEGFRSIEKELI
jgi:glycerol-3-phosphate dehydrogenase (NAD(P)+)